MKMVHNGIEYGDMQLICEAYHLMKDVLGMEHNEMAQVSAPAPAAAGQPSSFLLCRASWQPGWTRPNLREALGCGL